MIHGSDGAPREDGSDRRSLFSLARELLNDAARLVRQEIALARVEVTENLRRLAAHAGQSAVGGIVAVLGVLVLVEFVAIGLGVLLGGRYWLSTLIVAVVLIVGGGGLAYLGAKRMAADPIAPAASIERARETQRWIGEEVAEMQTALTGARVHAVPPPPRSDEHERAPDRASLEVPSDALVSPGGESAPPPAGSRLASTPVAAGGADRVQPGPSRHASASAAIGGWLAPGNSVARLPVSEPLLKRVIHDAVAGDLPGEAARVAFFMFTSIPPALLVTFSLAGLYAGDELAAMVTNRVGEMVPGTAEDSVSAAAFVTRYINEVAISSAPRILSVGALVGLWAGSAVFVSLTKSLNRAYNLPEDRSWIVRRGIAIGVMIAFLLLFLGGSLILIVGPQIAAAIGLSGGPELVWTVLQLPVPFLLVLAAFFIAYLVLPNRSRPARKVTLLKSALIATLLWTVTSLGFRLYVANFGSQGETYGFVGAVLVLLLWMYVTAMTILVGGEIGAELERQA